MNKFIKFLKKHWLALVGIVVILIGRAFSVMSCLHLGAITVVIGLVILLIDLLIHNDDERPTGSRRGTYLYTWLVVAVTVVTVWLCLPLLPLPEINLPNVSISQPTLTTIGNIVFGCFFGFFVLCFLWIATEEEVAKYNTDYTGIIMTFFALLLIGYILSELSKLL